jgi:hypothetical protein
MPSKPSIKAGLPIRKYGHVCAPIYREVNGLPQHLGTCVLLQSADGLWLFTAAHVLAQGVAATLMLPGKPFFKLRANVYSACPLTPEDTDKHGEDVSFIKLSQEQAEALCAAGHQFLPTKEETIARDEDLVLFPGECVVTGYIDRSVKINHETQVAELEPFCFATHFADPHRLRKVHRDEKVNIAVDYPGRVYVDGKERILRPNSKGLSGGAIWKTDGDNVRLVGIFTEVWEAHSLMVGTKVARILGAIQHFKDSLSK